MEFERTCAGSGRALGFAVAMAELGWARKASILVDGFAAMAISSRVALGCT